MKKINVQTVAFLLVVLAVFGTANIASASDASLYVSPASKTVKAGEVISGSVGISAGGNKIYAIEGTLIFNGVTCQGITVAGGIQALTSPTCDNPKFVLGVPGGSASDKTLLTVSSKAGVSGNGAISLSGVKIVGGESIKTISTSGGSGNYTVESVTKPLEAVVVPIAEVAPSAPVAEAVPATKVQPKTIKDVVPAVETAATSSTGTVLSGFEEQSQATDTDDTEKESSLGTGKIIAIVIVVIVGILGAFVLLKKKKA